MSELARDEHWQRLDPRMLLVHPVRELLRFLPVLVGLFVAGSATGGTDRPWQLLGVAVPVCLGVLRYLTTSFRIAGGRVELRRGLLNRHVLSTPVDRVRTVDVTASPIHRLLGLTTVRVGTGTASTDDDDRLDLDGLPAERARLLRAELLRVAPAGDAPVSAGAGAGDGDLVAGERVVLRLDPAWIRFAPLTSSGVVMAAAVLGAGSQVLDSLGGYEHLDLGRVAADVSNAPVWVSVPAGIVSFVVLVSLLSVGGYLVTNWGFTLTHAAGAWHLRRGLLTTRETSLDDERVSGVTLGEPLGLRLAGGGRVSAIVTGLDRRQQGSSVLVPPAPLDVAHRVVREVLGAAGPVDVPLVGHGPRARTRRFTRALVPAVLLVGAVGWLVAATGASYWLLAVAALALPAALALAADRARGLGHALTNGYVVARSGSLNRQRHALGTRDVIGWNFRATWFQRRAGLTSLVATTAGGSPRVTVLDVPEAMGVDLAARAVPGLVEPFRA
jgi:putative membrane protein